MLNTLYRSSIFPKLAHCGGIALLLTLTACGGSSATSSAPSSTTPVSIISSSSSLGASSTVASVLSSKASVSSSASVVASSKSASSMASASSLASSGYNTAGVRCDWMESFFNSDKSVGMTSDSSWVCSGTMRNLSANGVPNHEVGVFPNPNNPNAITAQNVQISYSLTPALVSTTGASVKEPGYALNGVKFDPGTGGRCDNSGANCSLNGGSGSWTIEALGQSSFNFGTDENNAHVQPGGSYHYHGMPEKFIAKLAQNPAKTMTLVGWASDGFPIYARYGFSSAMDASSSVKVLTSSYQLKTTADANRPAISLYPMGTFTQDYKYQAGSGDLDECNGRTGVTPEFPQGIYYYSLTQTYPFIQRCVKGAVVGGGD